MRNPRKVKVAFRRMVWKSLLTDKECASIMGVLRRAYRELHLQRRRVPKNFCRQDKK